jgi:adenylate cyclase
MRDFGGNRLPSGRDDGFWRDYLLHGSSYVRRHWQVFKHLPRAHRCRLCAAPFAGAGAPVMRLLGRGPSAQNPTICAYCFTFISNQHGGAEIECSMLFADIRGSTTIAESMSPSAFRELLDRFFTVACAVVVRHDGIVDKFVGDELVALFVPGLCGDRHARLAVDAARELLRATGHATPAGPWVGLGAGVHTASVWFGAVGQGAHREVTAVGDAMNVTARLASAAAAGEVLVTTTSAAAAGVDPSLERRRLVLKGRTAPMDVVGLRVPT